MPHPEVVNLQNVRHFKDVITYPISEFKIDVHSFRVEYSIFINFIKKESEAKKIFQVFEKIYLKVKKRNLLSDLFMIHSSYSCANFRQSQHWKK